MAGNGLGQFVGDETALSLTVVDGGGPEMIRQSLRSLFDRQSVPVREEVSLGSDAEEDRVVLFDGEEVLASSPLSAVYHAILGVNTDLYTTGARKLEDAALPDVLSSLAGTRFTVRDYPASDREKLLFVAISRAIERRAHVGGDGKVRSSFQRLSRIEDERGTRAVYERLSDGGLDVHIYGRPDWTPDPEFGVTVHGGYTEDFTRSWFVVYDPPAGADSPTGSDTAASADPPDATEREATPAALVALKRERSCWDGFWTFDRERVREIADYVEREL